MLSLGPVNGGCQPASRRARNRGRRYHCAHRGPVLRPACSGLMYAGVPTASPVSVSRSTPALATAHAMPKSATRAWPLSSRMFSGLNVPMDHSAPVCVAQGVRHLARDAQRVVEGELFLAVQPVAQRFPFDERHDVIKEGAGCFRRPP